MKACFRILSAAALTFLLGVTTASALAWNDTSRALPKPDVAAYTAAATRLKNALASRSSPPRLPDPLVQDFQDQSLALSRVIGTPATPVKQPGDLFTICQASSDIFLAYVSARGASGDADMDRNAANYLDETMPPLMFAVHCLSDAMPLMETFMVQAGDNFSPTQADGGRMMRGGLFKVLNGMGIMISSGGLGPAYEERFIDVLAQDGGRLAPYLSLDERAQLLKAFTALARSAPAAQAARYARFNAVLADKTCGPLCAL